MSSSLVDYVTSFAAAGYPVTEVVGSVCVACDGRVFQVALDDDEGCAQRRCVRCGDVASIADSAEYTEEAGLGIAECPCGGDEFEVAVGFALFDDGEVRWVSVGLRCVADDVSGVYADWKIDYSPSRHLLAKV